MRTWRRLTFWTPSDGSAYVYRETPEGLRMLLGAFRGGNPLGRIVGKPLNCHARANSRDTGNVGSAGLTSGWIVSEQDAICSFGCSHLPPLLTCPFGLTFRRRELKR